MEGDPRQKLRAAVKAVADAVFAEDFAGAARAAREIAGLEGVLGGDKESQRRLLSAGAGARNHYSAHPAAIPHGWPDFAESFAAIPCVAEWIVRVDKKDAEPSSRAAVREDAKWVLARALAWRARAAQEGLLSEPKNKGIASDMQAKAIGKWAPGLVCAGLRRAGVGDAMSAAERQAALDVWAHAAFNAFGSPDEHLLGSVAQDSLRGLQAAGWAEPEAFGPALTRLLFASLQKAANTFRAQAGELAKAGCAALALASMADDARADLSQWRSWRETAQVAADFCLADASESLRQSSGWGQAIALADAKIEAIELRGAMREGAAAPAAKSAQPRASDRKARRV